MRHTTTMRQQERNDSEEEAESDAMPQPRNCKHTRTPYAPRDTTSLRAFEKPAPLVILSPQLAIRLPTPGWGGLLPLGRQTTAKAPPRHPAPTQIDRPRIARQKTRHCPCLRSGPFRSASLLAPPRSFHPPSEYIKSPAKVQNCLPRVANSTPLALW